MPDCGVVNCSVHGACVDGPEGLSCVCDEGYLPDPDEPGACVVDTQCVRFRDLSDGSCRISPEVGTAAGLYFALDYCAGSPVLPGDLAELGQVPTDELADLFRITENGFDIAEDVGAFQTLADPEIESVLTILVDASLPWSRTEEYGHVIQSLIDRFISPLDAGAGDPPLYISTFVFDGGVIRHWYRHRYSGDDTFLRSLLERPRSSEIEALTDSEGSSLYAGLRRAIQDTDGFRAFRESTTHGGVVTTGTVLVVTHTADHTGDDISIIPDTSSAVLAVGIGSDITREKLRAIGPNGAVLALEQEDWDEAFSDFSARTSGYAESAYMLGWCSSALSGSTNVEVDLVGQEFLSSDSSSCDFDADLFSSVAIEASCNQASITSECEYRQCGGITACGGCSTGECCDAQACEPPGILEPCEGDNRLCAQAGQICVDTTVFDEESSETATNDTEHNPEYVCYAPAAFPQTDCRLGCPYSYYCIDNDYGDYQDLCVSALPRGMPCDFAQECISLNCGPVHLSDASAVRTCRLRAVTGELCSDEFVRCEAGSTCTDGVCTANFMDYHPCDSGAQCSSGSCIAHPTGNGRICWPSGVCFR